MDDSSQSEQPAKETAEAICFGSANVIAAILMSLMLPTFARVNPALAVAAEENMGMPEMGESILFIGLGIPCANAVMIQTILPLIVMVLEASEFASDGGTASQIS